MSKMLRVQCGDFGRVALLRASSSLAEHAHLQGHLIFWLAGAQTHMRVGGETVALDADHCALINSFVPHEFAIADSEQPVLFLLLYLEMPWLTRRCLELGYAPTFTCASIALNRDLRRISQDLTAQLLCVPEQSMDLDARLVGLLTGVLRAGGARSFEACAGVSGREFADFRIQRAMAYMKNHLDTRTSLDDVARAAGISRPHLFTLFRKYMRMTPNLFWNTLRMETALERLVSSDTPLADLALELGFTEHGNFSRFFRSHCGVVPSQYRLVAKSASQLRF